ncbi:MAG: MAPEG family protein [Myxococcota bacterium]
MDRLSYENPVFATYVVTATSMVLLVVVTAWLTVARMMREKGGYRAPEDLKKTPLNPEPHPHQIAPNERVERVRRIMANHLENIPFFLVVGLLFVLTAPSLLLARWLLWGYAISRLLHFVAYLTAQIHEIRATFWTLGSAIIVTMCAMCLRAAL